MKANYEKIDPSLGLSFKRMHNVGDRFEFNWHFHPEYELTLIVQGHGQRLVGDHYASFEAGDLVLLGPDLPHTWDGIADASGRVEAVVVQFEANCFGDGFFASLPEMAAIQKLLARASHGLAFKQGATQAIREAMLAFMQTKNVCAMTSLLNILDGLACLASEYVDELASGAYRPALRKKDELRIDEICQWMQSHFNETITHEQAAKVAHMSGPAFSRYFKKQMGRTFIAYLNELRIAEACRQLIETDEPITAICFGVGYGNQANFNRRFQALKNMTPMQFRKAYHR